MNERSHLHHRAVIIALAAAVPVALALGFLLGLALPPEPIHALFQSAVKPA